MNDDPQPALRASGPSPAEREWRQALSSAGYQVAQTNIRVHPSQLIAPGGDKRAAEDAYRRFVAAEPDNLMALDGLAFLLQHRGAAMDATQIRRQRYAAESRRLGVPEIEIPAVVDFLAASLGDGTAPPVSPAAYVESLFDDFSSIYDHQLLVDLQYCGPKLLREAVERALGAAATNLDVLDLGCGTGLAGLEFRPLARRLCGVDLSTGMLHLARAREIFDHLQQIEIVQFLESTDERFDLVIASDVLNYFGDLGPVFAGMARVLRPAGHCALTLELGEDADYRLRGMRRYQHSREYVERTASSAQLQSCSLDEVVLRFQQGDPVRAWRGVWRADQCSA
jgi:predicted TPR repeat methyltransferase